MLYKNHINAKKLLFGKKLMVSSTLPIKINKRLKLEYLERTAKH